MGAHVDADVVPYDLLPSLPLLGKFVSLFISHALHLNGRQLRGFVSREPYSRSEYAQWEFDRPSECH